MARQFAVLGSPISQSKSPQIHAAAYQALGVDWVYRAFDVPELQFRDFLAGAGASYDGFSVTMPLKVAAFETAERCDEYSAKTQIANTLLRTSSEWVCFNTDVFGIQQALRQQDIDSPNSVLIFGTGATAKSALLAVQGLNQRVQVHVAGRSPENVLSLCRFAEKFGIAVEPVQQVLPKADLVVSTLPPDTFESAFSRHSKFKATGTLLDVAYNPWPSQAAKLWINADLPVVNGIDMLIWQAIGQIRVFTNGDPTKSLGDEIALSATMLAAAR